MRPFGHSNVEESCAGTELLDDRKGLRERKVCLDCGACSTNGFAKKGKDCGAGGKVGACLISSGIVGAGEEEVIKRRKGWRCGRHSERVT